MVLGNDNPARGVIHRGDERSGIDQRCAPGLRVPATRMGGSESEVPECGVDTG